MVSEGVDIPRLRVGVYASAAKTPLIFRQIVGRFVRTLPGRAPDPSWLYLPAESVLRAHAAEIEQELRHALRREEPEEGFEEQRERRASEPSPSVEFEPLSAEFAAQMTLFGPPQRASAPATPAPPPAEEDSPPLAAFEQRAQLRQERSRLVAELHRRDGLSHREINAWLNRKVGVGRVDAASIQQLERSIEALVKELTRGPRRRGKPVRA
jgi:superfamily II DNA or RNA helicase